VPTIEGGTSGYDGGKETRKEIGEEGRRRVAVDVA
jgi:hypothetical protein